MRKQWIPGPSFSGGRAWVRAYHSTSLVPRHGYGFIFITLEPWTAGRTKVVYQSAASGRWHSLCLGTEVPRHWRHRYVHTWWHIHIIHSPEHGATVIKLPDAMPLWLVVSPLRQKSTRSGNLVLAGILAFYAIKTASLSPPRPSCYLHFSSAHGCCTTGVLLVDVGAHSPLTACTFKWFDPAKCFMTWYTLSDERSAPQLQSFWVGGRASSTASDCQCAHQPSLHVSITRALPYILYLFILRTRHYDVTVGCWFTGQGRKGDCVWQFGNCGPRSWVVLSGPELCIRSPGK